MTRGSSSKGTLYVMTGQPFYFSGSQVTGNVHFDLRQHFDADLLVIKIKGYEECQWMERMSRVVGHGEHARTEYYYEERKGKNSFYSHKIPLYQWNHASVMMPGQYTFPFTFSLTQGIPGTFREEGKHNGGDYKAVIKYKVKAEIEAGNGEVIKNKQELIIREQVKSVVSTQQERIVKPSTWCCISQGESKMKCYFEKNTYVPGETARLISDLDNSKCSLAMENMTCELIRVLSMRSKDGRNFSMTSQMQTKVFTGAAANKQERREADLPIGQGVKPSTDGKLIDCEYYIRVIANLEGCICCSDEPEVRAPVQIASLPPPNYGFQQPPGWNPQVFAPVTLVLSSQYMYTNPMRGPPVQPAITPNAGFQPTQQQPFMGQQQPNQGGQQIQMQQYIQNPNNPPYQQPGNQYPNQGMPAGQPGQYPPQQGQQPQQPLQGQPGQPNQQYPQQGQQYPPNNPINQQGQGQGQQQTQAAGNYGALINLGGQPGQNPNQGQPGQVAQGGQFNQNQQQGQGQQQALSTNYGAQINGQNPNQGQHGQEAQFNPNQQQQGQGQQQALSTNYGAQINGQNPNQGQQQGQFNQNQQQGQYPPQGQGQQQVLSSSYGGQVNLGAQGFNQNVQNNGYNNPQQGQPQQNWQQQPQQPGQPLGQGMQFNQQQQQGPPQGQPYNNNYSQNGMMPPPNMY